LYTLGYIGLFIFYYSILIFSAPPVDLSDVKLEPDEGELELQLALNKARKLKQIEDMMSQTTAERVRQFISKALASTVFYGT
jgi:hypothetical protein